MRKYQSARVEAVERARRQKEWIILERDHRGAEYQPPTAMHSHLMRNAESKRNFQQLVARMLKDGDVKSVSESLQIAVINYTVFIAACYLAW